MAAGRDPVALATVLLWVQPIEWAPKRLADGTRQYCTGEADQLRADAAGFAAAGASQIVVVLQAPTLSETTERLHRFATDMIGPR